MCCRGRMCGWGSGPDPALPLSSLSAGPTVHRPPSSRLCSPTAPPGKAQGSVGGAAPSECDSPMRPCGTQRSATGSAAVRVSSQGRESPRTPESSGLEPREQRLWPWVLGVRAGLQRPGIHWPCREGARTGLSRECRGGLKDQVEGRRSCRGMPMWVAPGSSHSGGNNGCPGLATTEGLLAATGSHAPYLPSLEQAPTASQPHLWPPPWPTVAEEGGKAPKASSSHTHEGLPG